MAYVKELDDLRQELRLSTAGTINFYPKVFGVGNVSIDAGTATFVVYDSAGTEVQSSTAITESDQTGYDLLPMSVNAISTLGEDYRCQVTWDYSSTTYRDEVYFDVVQWPYSFGGTGSVSLNDLIEERPDIERVIDRHALKFASATTEVAASIYGYRARVTADRLLRDRIRLDASQAPDAESAQDMATVTKYSRPALILNRGQFNSLERALTLQHIFEADSSDPLEGTSESDSLARFYKQRADEILRSMVLKYDTGEDLVADRTVRDLGRSVSLTRCQG